ncbi:ribosomal protein L7/L12 [Nocardioides sp.]|uniref:ribosomal protein L7/L12 n=1 Tax=Nocardioides sp. TaxID=35761 RepID=UPI0025CF1161|nr:ribosomal protein L7/L12 [Nocardioides sp.]
MGIFGTPQDQVDRDDLDNLRLRITRLETAVAALQAQSASGGVPYGSAQVVAQPAALAGTEPDWMAEVRSLKAQGKVINAIKVYRENTGLGLKEAKDAVEAMP